MPDKSRIILNGCRLQTDAISSLSENASYVPVCGYSREEFERFQQTVKKSGQIVEEFLLDALGSAIAEATVREAQSNRKGVWGERMGISYPYSPGYCGWKVSDQRFSFIASQSTLWSQPDCLFINVPY
ncbi:MAG: hypothetical protein ACLRTD_24575 [Bacteroides sp.]